MAGPFRVEYCRRDQYRGQTRKGLLARKEYLRQRIGIAEKALQRGRPRDDQEFLLLSVQLMRYTIDLIDEELQEREARRQLRKKEQ